MYRNISITVLVLFAVVLGLPASQGVILFSGVDNCWRALSLSGDIYCQLRGHDKYTGLEFHTCKLGCNGTDVKLPNEACPKRRVNYPCTQEDLEPLQKWSEKMKKRKDSLKQKWCKRA
uniref:Putative ixodes 10 kDa peptide protein n=1 Tax=Ixodes ricinus TaxID=34613 RepID=A0A0K8R439_IXORI